MIITLLMGTTLASRRSEEQKLGPDVFLRISSLNRHVACPCSIYPHLFVAKTKVEVSHP